MAGSLFEAFLSGRVAPLYGGHFANGEDRRRAVEGALRPLAPALAKALEAQQARWSRGGPGLAPEVEQSLVALREGAAAVVTGQQVGLFLGPLYTVYKAATAVRVARALGEETGRPVVPVFWLQSEDHDLPEIARTCVPALHGGEVLAFEQPVDPACRVSVEHQRFTGRIDEALAALEAGLGWLPHAAEHLALLRRHYRAGDGWVDAFAGVLAELFRGTGLLLVDPRDRRLAPLGTPLHRRALLEAEPLSQLLLERCALLERQGFEVPIHVRAGAPLSFFHPEGPEGPRYRLAPAGEGGFSLVGAGDGRVHTLPSLLASLESEPRSFSTSALLRPLLQDSWLPTAAYVGGPGEIAYFAQLQPLYQALGVRMPLLVPRARFRVVEPRADRLLSRLGLASADAALPEETLLRRVAGRAGEEGRRTAPAGVEASTSALRGEPPSPEALERALVLGFEATLRQVFDRLPPGLASLERAREKTLGTLSFAAGRFRNSYERALLLGDRSAREDVGRLKALLFPEGQPQERVFCVAAFAARFGERAFVERVLESIVPFDAEEKELRP